MKYAIIKDGTVRNVIVWDGETPIDADGELVNIDNTSAGPGWSYDGTSFLPPPDSDDA